VSRLAAVALTAGIIVGLYGLVIAPLIAAYDQVATALEETDALVVRYGRIAQKRADLEQRLAALEKRQFASGVYLEGDSDSLAAATLQERVQATIQSGGGKQRSIQILPAKSDGGFQRVSLRVQLTGTMRTLFDIIYALEAGRNHLFIENLDVRNRRARRRARVEDSDPELTIRFDVTGYLRPEIG
jgi:hypothetical protein